MNMKNTLMIAALVTLAFSACTKEPEVPKLNLPNTYESTTFWQDINNQLVLRVSLNSLVEEIKQGRRETEKLSKSTLESIFTSLNPTLESRTTNYYASLLMGNGGWFDNIERASGNRYTPGAPVGEGGVYGAYLFDENGLELEQLIEKGLFGAMSYFQAQSLLSTPSLSNLNKALYLFGAHPSFPNTSNASKTEFPDVHMATYAARRSDINDANSLYNQIRNNFIKAQAAITQGESFQSDRDAALTGIKQSWEKVNAATIINYCHSVIGTMSSTDPTDAQKANALHAYGECVGFMHGWRQLPANSKIITDDQIDQVLELLLAAPNQIPQSYKFITEPATQLPRLQQVISTLQSIYGFTGAEIESFKNNWINVQNR
jgi:hypothetical protein